LAWALENLVNGNVVNQIKVPEDEAKLARIALDRMLKIS
jgi:quinolinate synthase